MDRVSTTVDVRKKLGESRIGCSGRPDLAIPIEINDESGLFIMQLWWDPRWRVEEIVNTTPLSSKVADKACEVQGFLLRENQPSYSSVCGEGELLYFAEQTVEQ